MADPPDVTSPCPPPGTKCTANRSNGEPCNKFAIQGGYVCDTHGGRAPQVKDAARRRLLRQHINSETLPALLVELEVVAGERGPTEVLLDAVARCSAMVQIVGGMVSDLGPDDLVRRDRFGEPQTAHLVVMYDMWLDRASRAAKMAIDAGVAETLVRIEQEKASLLAGVLRSVFDDPALGLTAEQRAAAGGVAGRHLRALSAG